MKYIYIEAMLYEEIHSRMVTVENDIDIRIESIIDELEKLRDSLKDDLRIMREKLEKYKFL